MLTLQKYILLAIFLCSLCFFCGCDENAVEDNSDSARQGIIIIGARGTTDGYFRLPRTVAFSEQDACFYVTDKSGRIQRFAEDGEFLKSWEVPYDAGVEFVMRGFPAGLEMSPDNKLFVCDSHNGKIIIYSPEGKILDEFGRIGSGLGEFGLSGRIAFLRDEGFFVSDYISRSERITFYNADCEPKFSFGSSGKKDGEFARSFGICLDDDDFLYVCDAGNHRIQKFTKTGKFVAKFGSEGDQAGQLLYPYGICFDAELKIIIVAEFGNSRLSFFSKTGESLGTFGKFGRKRGEFAGIWDVKVGRKYYYVPDYDNNRLVLIKKSYLRKFINTNK